MQNGVSYEHLCPVSFIQRSAIAYPNKTAVTYKDQTLTYAQFYERARKLAGALQNAGIKKGDKVACFLPNIPPMLEAHFGPMYIGAAIVAINIRLSAREVGYILDHSNSKALIFDSEFAPVVREALPQAKGIETVVQVVDEVPRADDIESVDYEAFVEGGSAETERVHLDSEFDTIAINYTSGTTGLPKGVEYHSRGAYLNALGEILESGVNHRSSYLWTLPMFHCNGWCHTWGVTAVGGKHVCLRSIDPPEVFRLIKAENVTHFCCAPTVLTMLYSSPAAQGQDLTGVTITTAGAPPSPLHIKTMEEMGAALNHVYGLTETYGPHTICPEQEEWADLSIDDRAVVKARQGVSFAMTEPGLRVVDSHMRDIPKDAKTMGEVIIRGNNVMTGYYNDPEATKKAFEGGWFHSGDLAVWHPDGYIELKDRAKDVIISGGENISTQEVEKVIMEHPGVLEVCVVGVPDERWGEVPKAFITTRPGGTVDEDELIDFCKDRIARFKAPKYVEIGELPKTATGKIQKFVLRDREWAGHEKRIQ